MSRTIETEAINLEGDHCAVLCAMGELCGCGLVTLVYEIKTCENLLCGLFGQIYENLHQRKFPAIQYVLTVNNWLLHLYT